MEEPARLISCVSPFHFLYLSSEFQLVNNKEGVEIFSVHPLNVINHITFSSDLK